MPFDEPGWWYGADDRRARWLAPAARLWSRVAIARHARQHPYRSRLPVICIGNFTAGGTGKTPLALHIAALLKNAGENPVLLTRGYGGRLAGPLWVEPGRQDASDVGDEPLLLARTAPVMLARDRRRGALAIEAEENVGGAGPASVIVMDDGLQNPALAKDLAIALVDGMRGVGNGLVMPAGPLRAPLEFQLGLVDAIVVTRRPGAADPVTQAAQATTPTTPPTTTATDAQPGLSGQSAKSGKSGEPAEPPASAMDPTTAPIAGPRVLASLRQGFPGPVLSAAQSPVGDTSWLAGAPLFRPAARTRRQSRRRGCLSRPPCLHGSRRGADARQGAAGLGNTGHDGKGPGAIGGRKPHVADPAGVRCRRRRAPGRPRTLGSAHRRLPSRSQAQLTASASDDSRSSLAGFRPTAAGGGPSLALPVPTAFADR